MREIPLMRELLYESSRAIPWVRLFRRNILRLRVDDRIVISGIRGQCDLWGVFYGGGHIEVELKSQNGRLSPEQRAWRDWCLAGQIPWLCLWPWPGESSAETVQRWVEAIRLVAGPSRGTLTPTLGPEQTEQTSAPKRRRKARPTPTLPS